MFDRVMFICGWLFVAVGLFAINPGLLTIVGGLALIMIYWPD